jgi:hypothetical protein
MNAPSEQVWDRVGRRELGRRGFDDSRAWLAHFALPSAAAGEGGLSRPPVMEDLQGSFVALEGMCGWWARVMPCDPRNETVRGAMRELAAEVEASACAIKTALDNYEEQETT